MKIKGRKPVTTPRVPQSITVLREHADYLASLSYRDRREFLDRAISAEIERRRQEARFRK